MTTEVPRPPLKGKKALIVGVANDQSIAYGCAKAFHELGAELAITYINEKTKTYVEPLLQRPECAHLHAARRRARRAMLEAVFEKIEKEMGQARHRAALDRVRAESRPPGRVAQLFGRGVQGGDGRVLPLLRAHGEACRAADEGRRLAVRDELLRRAEGGRELQRDGTGQGGARSVLPLPRL